MANKKEIYAEITVDAPIQKIWDLWTTEKGITSFFAPACRINLAVWGEYEIYFNPAAPEGEKGAEGAKILAFEKPRMLSFTWNAPPHLPGVRKMNTHVLLYFRTADDGKTQIKFYHDGWGDGDEWDAAYQYFKRAWLEVVFPRLEYALKTGPVDWQNPPKF